jgi:hypothetical protein
VLAVQSPDTNLAYSGINNNNNNNNNNNTLATYQENSKLRNYKKEP